MPNSDNPDEWVEKFKKRVRSLKDVKSPYVIYFIGVCVDPPMLVMEYPERADLRTVTFDSFLQTIKNPNWVFFFKQLMQQSPASIGWYEVFTFALNMSKGVTALHAKDLYDNHIKSSHLLITQSWQLKISSKTQSDYLSNLFMMRPSEVVWTAPECITH